MLYDDPRQRMATRPIDLGNGSNGGGGSNTNPQQPVQSHPQQPAPTNGGGGSVAYNPLQATYMPTAPTVNPVTGQAQYSNAQTQLDPSLIASLGPNATIAQIMAGFAPQAARSTAALNNTLAAAGVVGGGAQDAQTLLQGNLASSIAPTLANAIMNSQGNQLNAGEFGVNNGLQQSMFNAGNAQQQTLANQQAGNQANLFNAQNIMNTNQYNATASNNANNQLASYMMQAYELPFSAYNQINTMGLGGASQLAQQNANNFPVYQSNNLMNLWGLI